MKAIMGWSPGLVGGGSDGEPSGLGAKPAAGIHGIATAGREVRGINMVDPARHGYLLQCYIAAPSREGARMFFTLTGVGVAAPLQPLKARYPIPNDGLGITGRRFLCGRR